MAKFTENSLKKFTKAQLVKKLAREGIEASDSQTKSELIKLLLLAHKANSPTAQIMTTYVDPIRQRRITLGIIGSVILFTLIVLYNFNPVFNQNVEFITSRIFGGSDPTEIVESEDGPQIYEKNGKTFVVYDYPLIKVKVITDKDCKRPECNLDNFYAQVKKNITPLVKFEEVHYESGQAENLLDEFGLDLLPVLIFDNNLVHIENFEEAVQLFTQKEDSYIMSVTPFRTLNGPNLNSGQLLGAPIEDDAPLKIVEFLSFSSSHDLDAVETVKKLLETFEGNITVVIKYFHRGGNDFAAGISAECAANQGKFIEMHDKLFEKQESWLALDERFLAGAFTTYAGQIGLNRSDFRNCYNHDEEVKARIADNNKEAERLAISGTPSFIVNNHILAGAYPFESFVSIIDLIAEEDGIEIQVSNPEEPADEIEE